jgi:hypothetical protein
LVLGFGCFPRICHSLFGAVIGALSNLVSVLIDLDVGALRLEFLNALELSFMDDGDVMVA